jgi:hypothetical protein
MVLRQSSHPRPANPLRAAFPDLTVTVDRLVQNETDIAIAYTTGGRDPSELTVMGAVEPPYAWRLAR